MSFEQAMLQAKDTSTEASTRAILWLPDLRDVSGTRKDAELLQSHMHSLQTIASGVRVTPSSQKRGYFVDSIHLTDRREDALRLTVMVAETAVLMSFTPVEITEARLGAFVPLTEPWNAWAELKHTDGYDVTRIAVATAEDIRSKMFEAAIGIKFQDL